MPELVGLGQLIGVGPKRMRELAQALGVRTTDEFRAAVAEGRLRSVPGVGPKTEAKLKAGLERSSKPRPRRGLLLNRAWALAGGVADALGGEVAGDPRRWRDSSEDIAVVVAADEPGPVVDRFEALTEIVSVVEREERRVIGVTVEGVPVELVVSPPESFGTSLVRATGSAPYVAELEPLPVGASEEDVYEALGVPWCPPELRERPHRDEPPPFLLRGDDVRGDLHVHTTWSDGRASVLEMGGGRDRARVRVPRDLRPHGERAGRAGPRRRRRAPAGRRDRGGERAARAVPRPPRDRVRHPRGRVARPSRRRARRARLGTAVAARRPEAGRAGADAEGDGGDAASRRQVPLAPDGAADQPPAAERTRPRAGVRGRGRGGRGDRGERAPRPARPARRARAPGDRGGRSDLRQHGRALGPGSREHAGSRSRRHGAARLRSGTC